MQKILLNILLVSQVLFICCNDDETITREPGILQLKSITIGAVNLIENQTVEGVKTDLPIIISFADSLHTPTDPTIELVEEGAPVELQISFSNDTKTITVAPVSNLNNQSIFTLTIGEITGANDNIFPGATYSFKTINGTLEILSATINSISLLDEQLVTDVEPQISLEVKFSHPLDENKLSGQIVLAEVGGTTVPLSIELSESDLSMMVENKEPLSSLAKYRFSIGANIAQDELEFDGLFVEFFSQLDSTYKFPEISDDELLTKIQEQTFKYFWDYGHPVSGLARERLTSGETVTSGGSGFGLMTILVGIKRGFITEQEGINRIANIVDFLSEADRFHGAWSHWINGTTGKAIPFSTQDDGGDLVETAFMVQGLLTVREYLKINTPNETDLIAKINVLWEDIEWTWYQRDNQEVLYWHWSPNFEWAMNHQIRGWNEALIVYVLAASSPTFPIDKEVYVNGWAQNGNIQNQSVYYDITLPLGESRGGPLFFSHYSFLGLDPRKLQDAYANYWDQNVSHSLINHKYCVDNPREYLGYSTDCWGLTASDNHQGYSAHSPNNDLGVITPTAAISSLPYTPQESMRAIRHFYYLLGDKLWGDYGFYDAFNVGEGWYADSYLAIDQGPIICMIENHRSGMLWELFMNAPEVRQGLAKLGFTYE